MSSSLRALCKAYADGHIADADYRQQRSEIIALLLNSDDDTTRQDQYVPPEAAQASAPAGADATAGSSRTPMIIGVAVVVIVLIAAGIFFSSGDDDADMQGGPELAKPAPAVSSGPMTPTRQVNLLDSIARAILQDNELSDDEIDSFLEVWELATTDQRKNWLVSARSSMADAELDGDSDRALAYDNLMFEVGEADLDEEFDDSIYDRLGLSPKPEDAESGTEALTEMATAGTEKITTEVESAIQLPTEVDNKTTDRVIETEKPVIAEPDELAAMAEVQVSGPDSDITAAVATESVIEEKTPPVAMEEQASTVATATVSEKETGVEKETGAEAEKVEAATEEPPAVEPESQPEVVLEPEVPTIDDKKIAVALGLVTQIAENPTLDNVRDFRNVWRISSPEEKTAIAVQGTKAQFESAHKKIVDAAIPYNEGKSRDSFYNYLGPVGRALKALASRSGDSQTMNDLLKNDPTAYTIQLVGTSVEAEAIRFAALEADAIVIETKDESGQPWFIVVKGVYPDRPTAVSAIPSVPSETKPWARSIGSIQEMANR